MNENRSISFRKEFRVALESRSRGLDGRSRVCARRAAAILVREYLDSKQWEMPAGNDLQIIQFLANQQLSPKITSLLDLYLHKVDIDFHLPSEVDLTTSLMSLADALEIQLDLENYVR